jgi:hypothetical protein
VLRKQITPKVGSQEVWIEIGIRKIIEMTVTMIYMLKK